MRDEPLQNNLFGERVAYLRRGKHLTQADLASRLGMAKLSVSNIENGLSEPRLTTIQGLYLILGSGILEAVSDSAEARKHEVLDE